MISNEMEFLKRGITICLEEDKRMIIHTTKIIDTLFYIQSLGQGRKLRDVQPDDLINFDEIIEGNILYYYK